MIDNLSLMMILIRQGYGNIRIDLCLNLNVFFNYIIVGLI